jgi:SAM-dependent methyltransferase
MSDTHFDEIADVYDESLPSHVVEHYLRKRTAFVREHALPGGAVLDVGCGTGVLAARIAEGGFEVTGIDPSEGMLDVLRKRHPSVRPVVGSGTALPFGDDAFDFVYCVAVMHHIAEAADVRQTLSEMVRVARPGGRILIWDHNPRNPYWRLLMARVPQDTGEERLIPQEEILAGLRAPGAKPTLVEQLGMVPDFTPPAAIGLVSGIERLAERTPGLRRVCAHNVILASKP